MSVVGTVSQFPLNTPCRVEVDGEPVLVVNVDGTLHAVDDTCSHAEVSLAEGEVVGCTIECWLHGSAFDLKTGKPLSPPASREISVHSVSLGTGDDPEVFVTLGRN